MQLDGQRPNRPARTGSTQTGSKWTGSLLAVALGAAIAPAVAANWRFARTLRSIVGPHAESIALEAVYPGLPAVLDLLQRHPDRRVFCIALDHATTITGFDPAKGLPTRVMEMLYPRPVLSYDPQRVGPGDLVVVEPARELDVPCDELLRGALAKVLQVRE